MGDSSTNYQILAACKDDQDDWLNDLLSQGEFDISFSDDNGDTALHYATQSGSLACLELLVRVNGIQVNRKNKLGNTPLYYAVIYMDDQEVALEMVNVLLDAGANPRIPNKNKETPLSVVNNTTNEDMNDLLSAVLVDNDLEENQVDDDDDDDDIAVGENMEY
ncbi:ankyrin repeat-containing domain protein [Absidia repens]|uniref:Ankyrin repeat-containing domain protein n=1 Tax=Absidia repens TaxID=90262 RepID=A0A1X2I2S8_9FUNG|nr:ankyrin repeat-containing domain protein [Absidia repens]